MFDDKTGTPTTAFWVLGALFILFLVLIGAIPAWYFLVPA